jgi:hypothetical protein
MPRLNISEAINQIEVIDRLVARKQQLIDAYLLREAAVRDPLERDGGTAGVLAREYRSIQALLGRKVRIRRAVQAANEQATITHGDTTRSVADWLVWKREVVARRSRFLGQMRHRIEQGRRSVSRKGAAPGRADLIVHVNEKDLSGEVESLEELRGYLAGQLALKNATVLVELPGDEAWRTGLEGRIDELLALAARSVWLMGLADPSRKISVIKVVREVTSMGLMEAKDLVEGAPRPVKENLPAGEAEQVRQRLEAAGAVASLR